MVPATAYPNSSNVNGMSLYKRNGPFANAGCVAAINLESLLEKDISPSEALSWVENLEHEFFEATGGYSVPACSIHDFIHERLSGRTLESSYPMGLKIAPLWDLFPGKISSSIRSGLLDFSHKIKGFETGNILGLESKTSSPIQAIREENMLCAGFKNLYMAGEGSGQSGGIISSAADGIKIAQRIIAGVSL